MRLLFIDPHVRFVELTYGSFSFVTVITEIHRNMIYHGVGNREAFIFTPQNL